MSTEGAGVVVLPLAAVALVGLAAAELVVLGVRGVMWCGKKMEENYERACKAWEAQYEAARAASRANVSSVPLLLAGELERAAASRASLTLAETAHTVPTNSAEREGMQATLARLRSLLDTPQKTTQVQETNERETLVYRLTSEIASGRGILPEQAISAAEAALHGSIDQLRAALSALQSCWQTVTDPLERSTYQQRQARQHLLEAQAQLDSIAALLSNADPSAGARYAAQKSLLEQQIATARSVLESNPEQALALSIEVRASCRDLTHTISLNLLNTWEQVRQRMLSARATLATLTKMVQEGIALHLMTGQQAAELQRRLSVLQHEISTIMQASASPGEKRLLLLNERVARIKAEVFRQTKHSQQKLVANTIATTLSELGYHSSDGGQATVRESGNILRVEVTRAGEGAGARRDDKVVSFDITSNADVSYDFSGYVGDSCLTDATRIFTALRAKGIYILSASALDDPQLASQQITVETLKQEKFAPQLRQNKLQADLAQRLQTIFARMNYATIKQSVVGGCIDIEAFNGQVGYRVMLSPDGSTQIFKNRSDISSNTQDPVVAGIQQASEAGAQQQASEAAQGVSEPEQQSQRKWETRKRQQLSQ